MSPKTQEHASFLLGWVSGSGPGDGPAVAGNRLRWRYPASASAGGLPERLILLRAELSVERFQFFKPVPTVGSQPTAFAPEASWRKSTSSAVAKRPLTIEVDPCQAVHFAYDGPATRLSVEDAAGRAFGRFALASGSIFYLEAAEIARLRFGIDGETAPPVRDLRTLDLYGRDHDYPFREVAEISVRKPLLDGASLDDVTSRLGTRPDAEVARAWGEKLVKGLSGFAGLPPEQRQALLAEMEALLGLSGQLAVMAGSGFADGPATGTFNATDRIVNVLQVPSEHSLAYRLIDAGDDRLTSNIAFVDSGLAAALEAPRDFSSNGFAVRPVLINDKAIDGRTHTPETDPPTEAFVAEGQLTWVQQHRFDLGVELHQEVGPSPFLGVGLDESDDVALVPTGFADLDLVGESPLFFKVAFPDAPVRMALRAYDGFDRLSLPTPDLRPELLLDHAPAPPVLTRCEYTPPGVRGSGRITLGRSDGNRWPQDPALARYGDARLFVYRRLREPTEVAVQIASIARGDDEDTLLATLSEPVDAAQFRGGGLLTPTAAYVVVGVEDRRVLRLLIASGLEPVADCTAPGMKPTSHVRLPVTLPTPGPATLTEPADGPGMWSDRTLWAEDQEPPVETSFDEPLPLPNGRADVLAYAARFEYRRPVPIYRRAGALSNLVFVQRQPRPPKKPPLFEAAVLGRDHYRRLVVEIRFATRGDGLFEAAINIVPATMADDIFSEAALPGVLGRQRAFQGHALYEIFSSPPPDSRDLLVRIGVKGVDEAGQESIFEVSELLIEAE